MARKYDSNTDSIVFANNQPYTKDSYNDAGMGETIEDLLRFCRQMWAMKVDNAEYALLTAIVIFSGKFFPLHDPIIEYYFNKIYSTIVSISQVDLLWLKDGKWRKYKRFISKLWNRTSITEFGRTLLPYLLDFYQYWPSWGRWEIEISRCV